MDTDHIILDIHAILLRKVPPGTDKLTIFPGCYALHLIENRTGVSCLDRPIAALTVSGKKFIQTAGHKLELFSGTLFVACVDLPSSYTILGASEYAPYLAIYIDLDRNILATLLSHLPDRADSASGDSPGAWTTKSDWAIADTFLRIARLIDHPEHAHVLGELALRELHYLLLTSSRGRILRTLYRSEGNGIMEVVAWLKKNTAVNANMPSLARMARMSVSSFHRHFKEITGLSPLQYHKKLRLFEAQRLMLAENNRVNEAALAVGYESVTQFNREYRRMFGEAPGRDINNRRKQLGNPPEEYPWGPFEN